MTFQSPPPYVSPCEVIPGSPTTVRAERYIPKLLSNEDEAQILCDVNAWELTYHEDDLPKGWSVHIHPEGNRYFVFSLGHGRNMITHANLIDPHLQNAIEDARERVFSKFSEKDLPENVDIVFDRVAKPDGFPAWIYYAACWDRQGWLPDGSSEALPASHLTIDATRIHVEICPCHRMLPDGSLPELKRNLQYLIVDVTTSQFGSSTSPYSSSELDTFLKVVKTFTDASDSESPEARWIVGRLNETLCYSRFIHKHGQDTACVDVYGTIHRTAQRSQPILSGVVSMLLFDLPHARMTELEKVYTDSIVRLNMWKSMIHAIEKDWNKSLIPVTVLLGADIGFLSVAAANKVASMIICISAIFCFASIIVSCILKHKFSRTEFLTSSQIVEPLLMSENSILGLNGLAVAFSLPGALFIWSVIVSFAGLSYQFLSLQDLVSSTVISLAIGISLLVIILVLMQHHPKWEAYPSLRQRIWEGFKSCIGCGSKEFCVKHGAGDHKLDMKTTQGIIGNTSMGDISCNTLSIEKDRRSHDQCIPSFMKHDDNPSLPISFTRYAVDRLGFPPRGDLPQKRDVNQARPSPCKALEGDEGRNPLSACTINNAGMEGSWGMYPQKDIFQASTHQGTASESTVPIDRCSEATQPAIQYPSRTYSGPYSV